MRCIFDRNSFVWLHCYLCNGSYWCNNVWMIRHFENYKSKDLLIFKRNDEPFLGPFNRSPPMNNSNIKLLNLWYRKMFEIKSEIANYLFCVILVRRNNHLIITADSSATCVWHLKSSHAQTPIIYFFSTFILHFSTKSGFAQIHILKMCQTILKVIHTIQSIQKDQ